MYRSRCDRFLGQRSRRYAKQNFPSTNDQVFELRH